MAKESCEHRIYTSRNKWCYCFSEGSCIPSGILIRNGQKVWEAFNGVGVDGVGGNVPSIFVLFFAS